MLLTLLLFIELFLFIELLLLSSHKPCSLFKESPEELIFLSFLNETASATARSIIEVRLPLEQRRGIEVRLPSCSAPRFIKTQDCLWHSKEHKVGALTSGSTPCYIMAHETARSNPEDAQMPSWLATHFIMGQDCFWNSEEQNVVFCIRSVPGDLLRDKLNLSPYWSKEQTSWSVYPLHWSSLSQRQSPSKLDGVGPVDNRPSTD